MQLYPLMLKLEGRRCLVVGGGPIAERKVGSLLACGAIVHVVTLECVESIQERAQRGEITVSLRAFQAADLDGMTLAIAATNNRAVNEVVTEAAHARGVLVNVVDVPDLCDFYVPAAVNRGPLQITVSTSGACPALAKYLRKELEQQYGPEYEVYAGLLARLRLELREHVSDPRTRVKAEEAFLGSNARALVLTGQGSEAERLLNELVARFADEQTPTP